MDIIEKNKRLTSDVLIAGYKNSLKGSKGIRAEKFGSYFISFILSAFCKENNVDFSTQATFKNHQRLDFVVYDWAVVFEILDSESLKDLDKKDYPLPIIPIPVTISLNVLCEMLRELEQTRGQVIEFYQKKMHKMTFIHKKLKLRGWISLEQWIQTQGVQNGS